VSGFVIERRDSGQPIYFSAKKADVATGFGSWTPHIAKALHFHRLVDCTDFAKMAMRHDEPFCNYVEDMGE